MNWESEIGPEDTSSLGHFALACQTRLQELLKEEESQEDAAKAKEGYMFWASRQSAEFNLWCTKVGIHDEGPRAIDVRLKDVPGIFELLKQLLQSLERDLADLQQPDNSPEHVVKTYDGSDDDDAPSDSSSLSFTSLSSSDKSEEEGAINDAPSESEKLHAALRGHIEDTIDRLHGHALQIDRAGAKHRRERIELYRQKDGPKWAYEAYKELAKRAAKSYFPSASEAFRQRLGESFARRRIRFEYLAEHQKKRAINMVVHKPQPSLAKAPTGSIDPDKPTHVPKTHEANADAFSQRVSHDQYTVYSATVNTKLDMQPQPRRQERAESVASVALRHPGFPPPPRLYGDSFQCPYCRLEFRANEAGKERWSQHVIQDFEPYFCILEDCQAPFDVPNSFDGLLDHLQSHLEERYHVDLPDGKHEEFDEAEFEHHLARHGEISTEMESVMKKASRRKGPFLFESCPFCGGYPDDIEKRFSDSNTLEAQKALRKHIKQHMQDIAFFLPPYREDILEEDEDLKSSVVTGKSANNAQDLEDLGEFPEICGQTDCDCKSRGRSITEILTDVSITFPLEDLDTRTDIGTPALPHSTNSDLWKELFPNSAVYDHSPVPNEYFLGDEHLRSFIVPLQSHYFTPSASAITNDPSSFALMEDSQALQDCMSSLAIPEINTWHNRFYLNAKSTCEWVLQNDAYLTWAAGRHSLLWIKGKPGSGKTTIVNRLIAKHRSYTIPGVSDIVLSFSFRSNGGDLQAARLDLYQSLLYQILEQVPDILPELIRTFKGKCEKNSKTGEAWKWNPAELRLFFFIAVARICELDHIWMFVDSLEVCGEENAVSLTKELKDLIPKTSSSKRRTRFHICLVCQSHLNVDSEDFLRMYPEHGNQDDMAIYIQDQISKATLSVTDILAFIIKKANGIFALVILLVEKVLELEQKQVMPRLIEEEIETIGQVIGLYHVLTARRGSLSWSLKTIYTIDELIVQLLIDEYADVWFRQNLAQTPLSWALESGYEVAVNLLLDKGAEMEFQPSPHVTPVTPSVAVPAQDGIRQPSAQISVPTESSNDLTAADASSINTSALDWKHYNHFTQESNSQHLEPGIMTDDQEDLDETSVMVDKILKNISNKKNMSMEGEAGEECALCKTPFVPSQAIHRCEFCGFFFDSSCITSISRVIPELVHAKICKTCLGVVSRSRPILPRFLSLSEQDIKDRFRTLDRAGREREDARLVLYKQPDNDTKMDRYEDIRPFVHNRIKLQIPENTSDYVNASPIILTSPSNPSQPPLRYIAMQGLTEASIDHVWRMIAEQTSSPAVIVQIKYDVDIMTCASTPYYPENEEPWNLNKLNLWGDDWRAKLSTVSSEIDNYGIETRKLLLHVHGEEEPRVVWHFLYANWGRYDPFGPHDLDCLVQVIKLSWQHHTSPSPRIIHYDTGGRTSMFIALDHLVRELNLGALAGYNMSQDEEDLVYNTVAMLRQQRPNMVENEDQYLYIYQAIRQLWYDKYGRMIEIERSGGSAA
ncbi:hypothetical protein ACQKWADRAFT_300213 [Trichoderma austrokoningii]